MRRYLEKYRQVLVTNYREFVLVGYDAEGAAEPLESYSLAADRDRFWSLAASPRKAATSMASACRVPQARACCAGADRRAAGPRLVPCQLCARSPGPRRGARPARLATTRAALEEALGMNFTGEKGEHFFRSTLVQTLFYGLFAAWVLWAEHHEHGDATARFDWRDRRPAICTSRSCRSSSTTSPTRPSSAPCSSTRCSTGPRTL